MPVPDGRRREAEQRIRAAAAALLSGDIPPGGRCDITTLARQAGVSRATLYRSYSHLKEQFEQDIAALEAAGSRADPRDAQIARLKAGNAAMKNRLATQDEAVAALEDFRRFALSRLAAQHEEIQRLRTAGSRAENVRNLDTARTGRPAGSR